MPGVSRSSIFAPSGVANCCPAVTKATATEFELVNPSKQSNFITGELVGSGQVSFIVENLPKDGTGCPGKWLFDEMLKHFASSVTAIQGFWTGPLSDNLTELNRLTSAGMTVEAGARGTWTGKRAAVWGYNKVQVVSSVGTTGVYSKVHVLFSK